MQFNIIITQFTFYYLYISFFVKRVTTANDKNIPLTNIMFTRQYNPFALEMK